VADIRVVAALETLARQSWDRLVGDDGFYLSYDWLCYVESERTEQPRYLLCLDSGVPQGALTLYRVREAYRAMYRGERFADLLGIAGRTLLAGACRGFRSTLLLAPSVADRTGTVAALISSARERAAAEGCAGIVLPFLTTGALLDVARAAPVRAAFDMAEAEILDCGPGLAAYAEDSPRRVRNKIRSDLARFAEAGWVLRERSLAECWQDAARLLDALQRKYGHHEKTLRQQEQAVEGQAKRLAGCTVTFTCEDERGIAGFAVFYRWRSTLVGGFAGFDYGRLRQGREYFNVTVCAPIQYAAGAGIGRLQLGVASWEAKGYRGAVLRPLWSAFIPAAGGGPPGLDIVNGAAVRQSVADITGRGIRIDPAEWQAPERFAARGCGGTSGTGPPR
jgi:uncharacterized protein